MLSATVHLKGPKYIRRDGTIHVMCSSDEIPSSTSAEFFINGHAHTSLRVEDRECYYARGKCPLNSSTCHCSQDGKQYGLLIRESARTMIHIMIVSCTMRFSKNGKQFTKNASLRVQIHGK